MTLTTITFEPTESVVVRRRYYPEASTGNGSLASVDSNRDSMARVRRTRPGQQRDPLTPCRPTPRQRLSDKRIVNKADDHESQRPPRPRPRRRRRRRSAIPNPQAQRSKLEESVARVQEWLRSCGDSAMEPDTCTWRCSIGRASRPSDIHRRLHRMDRLNLAQLRISLFRWPNRCIVGVRPTIK